MRYLRENVRLQVVICVLLLVLLLFALVACQGGRTTTSTPTPSPTARLSPLLYAGDGFTIQYPSDWVKLVPGSGEALFSDPPGMVEMFVGSADNKSGIGADATVHGILISQQASQLPFQQLKNVHAYTTIGGEIWSQGVATYDAKFLGQVLPYKMVVLAVNHTFKNKLKGFLITYTAPTKIFDQVNRDDFQPMLKSFAFS